MATTIRLPAYTLLDTEASSAGELAQALHRAHQSEHVTPLCENVRSRALSEYAADWDRDALAIRIAQHLPADSRPWRKEQHITGTMAVLDILKTEPQATNRELMRRCDISSQAAQDYLEVLDRAGLIKLGPHGTAGTRRVLA